MCSIVITAYSFNFNCRFTTDVRASGSAENHYYELFIQQENNCHPTRISQMHVVYSARATFRTCIYHTNICIFDLFCTFYAKLIEWPPTVEEKVSLILRSFGHASKNYNNIILTKITSCSRADQYVTESAN